MKVLLDTCTFLWLTTNAIELSDDARKLFRDPFNEIYLSVVSAWEIAVKHGLGRLPLPQPADQFVPKERLRHGIETLSLRESHALGLVRLPRIHRDPFDRMLVCQAIAEGLTILTPDAAIRAYPAPTIW